MTRALGAGLMLAALGLFGAVLAQDSPFPVPAPPMPPPNFPTAPTGGVGAPAGTPGGIIHTKLRQFRVPVVLGEKPDQISQLQLYVSTDSGRTWVYPSAATPDLTKPDKNYFRFSAER